jgi:hypothetical protein
MDLPETRPLTLGSVLAALAFRIDESLQWQVIDPARPDSGALLAHDTGLADASHTATVPLLVGCAYLSLAHTRGQAPYRVDAAALLDRATLATDYLLRAQRSSGLIDLLSTNYDSGPDTGFAVQALCTVLELGRPLAGESAAWAGLLARIEQFVRRAAVGMLRDGGFHTPNHRWGSPLRWRRPVRCCRIWRSRRSSMLIWLKGSTSTLRAPISSEASASTTW